MEQKPNKNGRSDNRCRLQKHRKVPETSSCRHEDVRTRIRVKARSWLDNIFRLVQQVIRAEATVKTYRECDKVNESS